MQRIATLLGLLLVMCFPIANVLAQESVSEPKQAGKVMLLLNVMEPEITNSHLGVTMFTNYDKKLDNDWEIPDWTAEKVGELLSADGYRVVKLEVPADRAEAIRSYKYIKTGWSNFKLEPGFAQWIWTEMDKSGANSALILRTYERKYAFNSPVSYAGFGVMTLHGKQPKLAFLHANVGLTLIDRSSVELPNGTRFGDTDCRTRFDPAEVQVEDFESLTSADLKPYREKLQALLETRIRQDLTHYKLIAGEFTKCKVQEL